MGNRKPGQRKPRNFDRGVPVVIVRRDVKGTEWRLHAGHRFWTQSLPWEVLSSQGSQWGLVCYLPMGTHSILLAGSLGLVDMRKLASGW